MRKKVEGDLRYKWKNRFYSYLSLLCYSCVISDILCMRLELLWYYSAWYPGNQDCISTWYQKEKDRTLGCSSWVMKQKEHRENLGSLNFSLVSALLLAVLPWAKFLISLNLLSLGIKVPQLAFLAQDMCEYRLVKARKADVSHMGLMGKRSYIDVAGLCAVCIPR